MVVNRRCTLSKLPMWNSNGSALQTLHKASSKAREENYFQGGLSHDWVDYYERRIESDRSCLNEWHAMDDLESRRPPSPDSIRTKPRERDETERVIRSTLKEIMMSVDLDEVTSKYIRNRLEEELDMDLGEYKSFIDQEMLTILGQMDAPTEIFDHVYLGSEWNASNYEELKRNGVRHILNVTREIDNFFPGTFDYLNVRVYDDEKTDLLKYWDNTYKYITKARKEGSKVLVHCKMGVSRSASVVIAYAMKAYNWDFKTAMQHVKEKRTCIKPNTSFVAQLETYQGILDAMKNKEKLQRSKSETNLKLPGDKCERTLPGSQPTPLLQALSRRTVLQTTMSGQDLRQLGSRPKSWSPDNTQVADLLSGSVTPFRSLENLNRKSLSKESLGSLRRHKSATKLHKDSVVRNVLLPCDNGESYSVSPNQIRHLPGQLEADKVPATVKQMVNEFESQKETSSSKDCRKKLVLNLAPQNDDPASNISKPSSPNTSNTDGSCSNPPEDDALTAQTKLTPPMLRAVLVKKEIWDPGEKQPSQVSYCNSSTDIACDFKCSVSNEDGEQTMWTSSTVLQTAEARSSVNSAVPFSNTVDKVPDAFPNKTACSNNKSKTTQLRKDGDPFSNQLDRVFDREERKQQRVSTIPLLPPNIAELTTEDLLRDCPSRQSSWGSYDSAVVLGYQGETRDAPSRHSSWGSGDTRTLPSRNSSWGSYDMRPGGPVYYMNEKGERVLHPSSCDASGGSSNSSVGLPYEKDEFPWHPGSVKKTKQKLEETSGKKMESKQENGELLSFAGEATVAIQLLHAQYKSPSSETLHSAEYPTSSVTSENESGIVEAFNPVFVQCAALENNDTLDKRKNSSSAISAEIDIVNNKRSTFNLFNGSRLSASAPENSTMEIVQQGCSLSRSASNVSSAGKISRDSSGSSVANTTQCFSVKQHKNFLESLSRDSNVVNRRLEEPLEFDHNTAGIVRSLKKEFEAKTSAQVEKINQMNQNYSDIILDDCSKHKSLPSSPHSIHTEREKCDLSPTNSDPGEDLSFKKLIGKFEVGNRDHQKAQVNFRSKAFTTKSQQNRNGRFSCIEMSSDKNSVRVTQTPLISGYNNKSNVTADKSIDSQAKRPPVAPVIKNQTQNVVVATVIAKAAIKQQQFGKTHPLARINIKPRHNNPVYNTM